MEVRLGMFTTAFDASGTDGTPILTVAGFVSSAQHWDEFSVLWEERLSKDDLQYFRAAECAHSTGQFDGWKGSEIRRRDLLKDLMDILTSHVYRQFGCTIVNEDFEKLSGPLKNQYILTAYSLAGRTCEKDVREWARWAEKIKTRIEMVFEEGDADSNSLRKRFVDDLGYEPIFRPKKDKILADGSVVKRFVPLQAADWLAYELSLAAKKYCIGPLSGKLGPISDLRWPMQQFMNIQGVPGIYAAEEIEEVEKKLKLLGELTNWARSHNLLGAE